MQDPHDIDGFDVHHRPRRHADPRMVIDDVEDLEHRAGLELDMSDVGLPTLVGQVSNEADERALRPFLRLGSHEPAGFQHPARSSTSKADPSAVGSGENESSPRLHPSRHRRDACAA
jgi:hypothetical protein